MKISSKSIYTILHSTSLILILLFSYFKIDHDENLSNSTKLLKVIEIMSNTKAVLDGKSHSAKSIVLGLEYDDIERMRLFEYLNNYFKSLDEINILISELNSSELIQSTITLLPIPRSDSEENIHSILSKTDSLYKEFDIDNDEFNLLLLSIEKSSRLDDSLSVTVKSYIEKILLRSEAIGVLQLDSEIGALEKLTSDKQILVSYIKELIIQNLNKVENDLVYSNSLLYMLFIVIFSSLFIKSMHPRPPTERVENMSSKDIDNINSMQMVIIQSRDNYRKTLDNVHTPICRFNVSGRILSINIAFHTLVTSFMNRVISTPIVGSLIYEYVPDIDSFLKELILNEEESIDVFAFGTTCKFSLVVVHDNKGDDEYQISICKIDK